MPPVTATKFIGPTRCVTPMPSSAGKRSNGRLLSCATRATFTIVALTCGAPRREGRVITSCRSEMTMKGSCGLLRCAIALMGSRAIAASSARGVRHAARRFVIVACAGVPESWREHHQDRRDHMPSLRCCERMRAMFRSTDGAQCLLSGTVSLRARGSLPVLDVCRVPRTSVCPHCVMLLHYALERRWR